MQRTGLGLMLGDPLREGPAGSTILLCSEVRNHRVHWTELSFISLGFSGPAWNLGVE